MSGQSLFIFDNCVSIEDRWTPLTLTSSFLHAAPNSNQHRLKPTKRKQDANAALGIEIEDLAALDPVAIQSRQQQQAHARVMLGLQRDAAAARKQLLSNFAEYDALARRIRNLPPDVDAEQGPAGAGAAGSAEGDHAQERVQQAIFHRANLFLQQNVSARLDLY